MSAWRGRKGGSARAASKAAWKRELRVCLCVNGLHGAPVLLQPQAGTGALLDPGNGMGCNWAQ